MKHILTFAAAFAVAQSVDAAYFADQVIAYSAGSYAGTLSDPSAATGTPAAIQGAGTMFPSVLNPFSPPYEGSQIVAIGAGGQITLRLSNFVTIDRTPGVPELGVWENVGLIDADYPNGKATSPASVFGSDSAVVQVSEDGVNWFSLNGGAQILFTLPGNYFTNAGPADSTAPANPQYTDFGKPFAGSLSDFSGKSYSQILTLLDGSAGGTWLNLDAAPFNKVGFIRFTGIAAGETLELDSVAINSSLAGAAVPEPGAFASLLFAASLFGGTRRKRAI